MSDPSEMGHKANFGRVSALSFMANSNSLAEILFGGVCHRFPDLKFVSVESGIGWIPFVLESIDYEWEETGAQLEVNLQKKPSDYFRDHFWGCFWFEKVAPKHLIDVIGEDNVLFETDFPHPTCMHPGLEDGLTQRPGDYAQQAFQGVPEDQIEKVLWSTASRLYKIE